MSDCFNGSVLSGLLILEPYDKIFMHMEVMFWYLEQMGCPGNDSQARNYNCRNFTTVLQDGAGLCMQQSPKLRTSALGGPGVSAMPSQLFDCHKTALGKEINGISVPRRLDFFLNVYKCTSSGLQTAVSRS